MPETTTDKDQLRLRSYFSPTQIANMQKWRREDFDFYLNFFEFLGGLSGDKASSDENISEEEKDALWITLKKMLEQELEDSL